MILNFIEQCATYAKQKFSIGKLRDSQEEVLNLIFNNKYVLATLPTGAGKTLLYALPALIFETGPTVVISPLIALMRDQFERMEHAQIKSALLTSAQDEDEKLLMRSRLWDSDTKLIFISPERFVMPQFLNLLEKIKPAMVVVDEAHCVVSWGHQFRPEYSELGKHLTKLNPQKICALTATASARTRNEIIKKVFPTNCGVNTFVSNPISKHIHVQSRRVFSLEDQWNECLSILNDAQKTKVLIYFSTRTQCDDFSKRLIKKKINAFSYHAGLHKNERFKIEQMIKSQNEQCVICATTAFGLGVNIQGINKVIVYGFPANIEEFYQMIGRAGRGGEHAEGILLWTGSDPVKRGLQFRKNFPTSQVLMKICTQMSHIFPKSTHESKFINLSDFEKCAKQSLSKKENIDIQGLIAALRVCDCCIDTVLNEDYLYIKLSRTMTLEKLLSCLPEHTTKRKLVLDALVNELNPALKNLAGAEFVVSETKLVYQLGMSPEQVQNVFLFYATQKELTFDRIPSIHAKQGLIIRHDLGTLKAHISNYVEARNNFQSSLKQLELLAFATQCRLSESFDYFAQRSVIGAKIKTKYCYQCDLCQKNGRIDLDDKK